MCGGAKLYQWPECTGWSAEDVFVKEAKYTISSCKHLSFISGVESEDSSAHNIKPATISLSDKSLRT